LSARSQKKAIIGKLEHSLRPNTWLEGRLIRWE
jgi:hypothetical protein